MAILKFDKKKDFVNRFTLHPSRSFTSASDGTTTGSIKLTQFPIRTRVDLDDASTFEQGVRKSLRTDSLAAGINANAFDDIDGTNTYFEHLAIGTGSAEDPSVAPAVMSAVKNVNNYGPDTKYLNVTRYASYLETATLPLNDYDPATLDISISSTGSFYKNSIRKHMFVDNVGTFRKCDWAYSNANTINFFTASSVESAAAVIYPDPTGSDGLASYRPDSGFTFEFCINPRYTTDAESLAFHAGTILHYSSAYALSLITGSSTGVDGRPDGFRLLLQLSSSADNPPSSLAIDAAPVAGKEMVYSSSDNSLTRGKWHHVAVRWGGLSGLDPVQEGTGSFVIDGVVNTEFVIPSASITAPPGETDFVGTAGREDANALFIGNYFNGPNIGANATAGFFNSNASTRDGVLEIQGAAGSLTVDPTSYGFTNKLNAELHELRVFKEFRDIDQINAYKGVGFGESQFATEKTGSLKLYVPPFFVMESPKAKRFLRLFGLVDNANPAFTPFNVTMSFNNEGFVLNHSNFFRDFVTKRYPRFFNLTGSTSTTPVNTRHANDQLRSDSAMNARNFLILPNDNGSFSPDYTLLKTGTFTLQPTTSSLLRRFTNDRSITDLSIISLNRMLDGRSPKKYAGSAASGSLYESTYPDVNVDGRDRLIQAFWNDRRFVTSPESIGVTAWDGVLNSDIVIGSSWDTEILYDGADRTDSPATPAQTKREFYVFEATGDESSNQVAFFNIPNVFYGQAIKPGTLTIRDTNLIGSDSKVSVVLKDDGFGSLYRANSPDPNKLHSVGNVFYSDGVVVVKSPHLFQFGSGSYSLDFKGTQDVFNREMLVEAPKNLLNTSSNPTFQKLAPTDDANETADEFVYITTVLLHDEDLNVIGRAALSQPVVKRVTDGITFRLKKDF